MNTAEFYMTSNTAEFYMTSNTAEFYMTSMTFRQIALVAKFYKK